MDPFIETKEKIIRNQISRGFPNPSQRWFYSDRENNSGESQKYGSRIKKRTCRRKEGKRNFTH